MGHVRVLLLLDTQCQLGRRSIRNVCRSTRWKYQDKPGLRCSFANLGELVPQGALCTGLSNTRTRSEYPLIDGDATRALQQWSTSLVGMIHWSPFVDRYTADFMIRYPCLPLHREKSQCNTPHHHWQDMQRHCQYRPASRTVLLESSPSFSPSPLDYPSLLRTRAPLSHGQISNPIKSARQ